MNILTSTKDCTINAADAKTYLTWNEMNTTLFGSKIIETETDIGNLCQNIDPLLRVVFPHSKLFFLAVKQSLVERIFHYLSIH